MTEQLLRDCWPRIGDHAVWMRGAAASAGLDALPCESFLQVESNQVEAVGRDRPFDRLNCPTRPPSQE